MTVLRARIGIALIAVLVVGVGVVVALPTSRSHRDAVGTNGPATTEPGPAAPNLGAGDTPAPTASDASAGTTAAGNGTVDRVVTADDTVSSSTTPTDRTSTSDHPRPTTSTTGAGSTTTTPAPTGPHDLLGRVAYIDTSAPTQMWSMAPDGTDRRREVGCDVPSPYAWAALSPDGTQLLYDCQVTAPDMTGPGSIFGMTDLFVRGVDGAAPRAVYASRTGLPLHATWSPDGRNIAVTEQAQYAGTVIVDTFTGTQRPLLLADGSSPEVESWSPDGTTVVLPGLRLLDLTTGAVRQLVADSLQDNGLPRDTLSSWSPDGAWIYYLHDGGGYDRATDKFVRTVNRVQVATGKEQELVPFTDLMGADFQTAQAPVVTSDGLVLVLDGFTLWAMDADGSHLHTIDASFAGSYLSVAVSAVR